MPSPRKDAAIQLMRAAITLHLPRMRRESRIEGWEPWYIGVFNAEDVGRYKVNGERGGRATSRFTIQAQVNWLENQIAFHGFPDERLRVEGLGKTKSTIA